MLRNLNPVITGDLLRVLDAMKPGEFIALVSDDSVNDSAGLVIEIDSASAETVAEAIFSVLPLPTDDPSPIFCWIEDPTDDDAVDIAFAVRGLASDAEYRHIGMTTLGAPDFGVLADQAVATVKVPSSASAWSFLIRAGRK